MEIRLTKVRYADETVRIGYQLAGEGLHTTSEAVGEQLPPPEFEAALNALKKYVPLICAPALNPGEFTKSASVTGVSISYKNNHPIYVIKAKIPVNGANGPLNVATPPLMEPEEDSGEHTYRADLFRALREVVRQGELYLEGYRAQVELFGRDESGQASRRPGGAKGRRAEEDQLAAKRSEKEAERALLDIVRLDLVDGIDERELDLAFVSDRIRDRFDGYAYVDQNGREWEGIHRHVTDDRHVVWCGLSNEGGISRFWYDIQPDAWDAQSSATLMGDVLAGRVLRAFLQERVSHTDVDDAAAEEVEG